MSDDRKQLPPTLKTWRCEEVEEMLEACAELLGSLVDDVVFVYERAIRDCDYALRSKSNDGSVAGGKYGNDGANNGGTPRLAINRLDRSDPVTLALRGYLKDLVELSHVAAGIAQNTRYLKGMPHATARELAEMAKPMRAAPCANCKRMVQNTPNDPIRAGRCPACWQWRRRHNGEERPKDRWEENAA